ncbi:FecR domain-containing protein [Nitrospira sp. KM1]|uniref:FecR family protein n=1 Tax=Nitrospira sp. KM1 TaxID=1936990 RepID=UPI001563774B|nr:FecR domain-containing protein [Nitrospira sp. KM1]
MNPPEKGRTGSTSSPDVYDEAVRWLMALKRPSESLHDRHAFERWLAADPEHARAYARCRADWEGMEPLAVVYGPQADGERTATGSFSRSTGWKWMTAMAAMLAALVTIGWFTASWFLPTFEVTAQTQAAERKTMQLADGSNIELNGRSHVRVKYFRGRRVAHLEQGEAIFDVTPDSSRPFTVEAGIGRVRVIGTSFQVTREADHLAVAVLRGRVQVDRVGTPKTTVVLSAGQGTDVTAAGIDEVKEVTAAAVGSWTRKVLVFDHAPLRDVVSAIQRQYAGTIQLDAEAAEIPLTAVVQFADIDTTLTALSSSLPVQVDHPAPARWYIRRNGKS